MNFKNLKTPAALLTLGVLGAGALQPAPAQAADKEKLYKGGAVALGVLGAYYVVKGKTVPGAIAGAGAYYAYKKGKDENDKNNGDDRRDRSNRNERRSSRNDDFRLDDYLSRDYGRNNNNRDNNSDNTYPDYSLR